MVGFSSSAPVPAKGHRHMDVECTGTVWGAHSVPPTQAYRGSANPQHLSDGLLGPKLKDRKEARPSLLQSLNWAPLLTSFWNKMGLLLGRWK